MHRTQILLEPEQHQALKDIARQENRSLSEVIRRFLDRQLKEYQRMQLSRAAEALHDDYASDPELTAFSALDGEDFHADG